MTGLPIPFFSAFLLALLALSNAPELRRTATGRVFLWFLGFNVASMIAIGFRWSHDLVELLPIAAVLSVAGASLLYLAFCSLGREGPVIRLGRDWPHLLPSLMILLIGLVAPIATESLFILIKLFYAGLLFSLANRTATSLQLVRLVWFQNAQKALWGAATLLIFSVLVDIVIAIDFMVYDGQHAARFVGFVNLLVVLLLGWASVFAARGRSDENISEQESVAVESGHPESVSETVPPSSNSDSHDLYEKLNRLLHDERLFADSDLNLKKLARKVGVPTREVSRAINQHAEINVSQWINSARVDAACEALVDTEVSVTQAMMDAGFLTKSNFNREFRRLKGCSPTQWRENQSGS